MIYTVKNINSPEFTQELYEKAYNAMAQERKEKADRYRNPEDKRLCVFADMLVRELLKEHFSIENPVFSKDENGKPVLQNKEAHFSISHSKSFVACAVDSKPVGIDIEELRPIPAQLIKRVCTCEEKEFINSNGEALSPSEVKKFLQVWTAKEAYLKYTGKGLGGGLQSVSTVENREIKRELSSGVFLKSIQDEEYILSIVSENN